MISVYGAGPACVVVDGCVGDGEFYTQEPSARRVKWRGDLVAPDGGALRVHALFDGCWHFSAGSAGHAAPVASWGFTLGQHPTIPYSALLEVDAPDGTRLANVWPEASVGLLPGEREVVVDEGRAPRVGDDLQ